MAWHPKYRRQLPRDLGFVEYKKRRIYFSGKWGSLESQNEYREFLRANGFVVVDASRPEGSVSLAVLIDRFIAWAEVTFPRGRVGNLENATNKLAAFSSESDAAVSFTPLKFKAFQKFLIAWPLSRRTINDITANIKYIFKWAVSEELIPVASYQSLLTVPGLAIGRTAAKESEPRKPVDRMHVKATLAKLSAQVRAMVELQSLTGVRSQSICAATPAQFDRKPKLWVWKPRHKGEYRGHVLTIFVGPKGQKILSPYLKGKRANDFVFQPRNRAGKRSKPYRAFYDTGSYRTAVQRGARRAGVPKWSPHQLRHSLGTDVREKHGLEAAQAVLGHVRIDATQIYAQKQLALAKMVAETMG